MPRTCWFSIVRELTEENRKTFKDVDRQFTLYALVDGITLYAPARARLVVQQAPMCTRAPVSIGSLTATPALRRGLFSINQGSELCCTVVFHIQSINPNGEKTE